jgi:hypothetical protein
MPVRFVEQAGLSAALVVARPLRGGDALVVVDPAARPADVLDLSAMLLHRGERAQLRRFLTQSKT